ncbi:MAG: hypothetical protein LW832_06305 [Parachlamydia sp.]|jgi:hypothetical protein|nr:hypothetical protein [Parachlamydia sp.]
MILISGNGINWLRKSNWAKLDSLKESFEAIKKDKIARDDEIIEWKEQCNQTIDYFTPHINKLQKQLEMARQLNKVRETWHLSIQPKAEEPGSLLKNFTDYIFGSSTPPVETSDNAPHLDALPTTQAEATNGVEQEPATIENETAK